MRYKGVWNNDLQYSVPEHRIIWKAERGTIPTGCYVHHIDGNPLNNKIENLAVVRPRAHTRFHCGWLLLDTGQWLKHCNYCNTHKSLTSFGQRIEGDGRGGYQATCKKCRRAIWLSGEYKKERRNNPREIAGRHTEKHRVYQREWMRQYRARERGYRENAAASN